MIKIRIRDPSTYGQVVLETEQLGGKIEEITVIHLSEVYKFTGILLGKDRKTEMYKTAEGKYIVFEKESESEGGMTVFPTDQALLNNPEYTEPQWIKWAGLEFPESMVKRL
ncbi:hypothetical protein SD53_08035 [Rheinheimera mesophila]|nr:hypothetical protein SD53_08035 [Rheinheimera mesophila]